VRAQDIVGISFFALLFCAILVTICGSRTSLTPRHQAAWRGCGLSLISVALVAFGVMNFQLIHTSPRLVVEGNLWDIREEFKNSLTRFMITDATGHAVMILCNHRGPGFVQGERARVQYVAYNNKLVEMDMLSGPYGAWHLRESSGEAVYCTWVGIGLFCGLLAYFQFAKTSPGQTTAP
jgi:hypothetical protein